jgi:tRNA(Ile)-lysidine synthase
MLDRTTIERIEAAPGPLVVALSGGGDSVALLHLLTVTLGAPRLVAVIVDHGLREGSAADAEQARRIADGLGVTADVLALSGVKPAQANARRARYAALCDHARRIGTRVIVTGHTLDDQAETVLMRAAAGSSWRGLAGMAAVAPAPLWPEGRGIALARPLLGARRLALRAFLHANAASWIEDPANENVAFERVRVRQQLAALEGAGFLAVRLATLAARLRTLADAANAGAAALVATAARLDEDIRVSRAAWAGPLAARRRALSVLIAAAAGADAEPASDAVALLEARFLEEGYRGETVGGVVVSPTTDGALLGREAGAVLGRRVGAAGIEAQDLRSGEELVWDGRYAFTAEAPGWRVAPAAEGPRFFRCVGPGGILPSVRPLLAEHVAHLLAGADRAIKASMFTRL